MKHSISTLLLISSASAKLTEGPHMPKGNLTQDLVDYYNGDFTMEDVKDYYYGNYTIKDLKDYYGEDFSEQYISAYYSNYTAEDLRHFEEFYDLMMNDTIPAGTKWDDFYWYFALLDEEDYDFDWNTYDWSYWGEDSEWYGDWTSFNEGKLASRSTSSSAMSQWGDSYSYFDAKDIKMPKWNQKWNDAQNWYSKQDEKDWKALEKEICVANTFGKGIYETDGCSCDLYYWTEWMMWHVPNNCKVFQGYDADTLYELSKDGKLVSCHQSMFPKGKAKAKCLSYHQRSLKEEWMWSSSGANSKLAATAAVAAALVFASL